MPDNIQNFDKQNIELAERAERIESVRKSIDDMRAGRVTPAKDMLAEMRQVLAATKKQ